MKVLEGCKKLTILSVDSHLKAEERAELHSLALQPHTTNMALQSLGCCFYIPPLARHTLNFSRFSETHITQRDCTAARGLNDLRIPGSFELPPCVYSQNENDNPDNIFFFFFKSNKVKPVTVSGSVSKQSLLTATGCSTT